MDLSTLTTSLENLPYLEHLSSIVLYGNSLAAYIAVASAVVLVYFGSKLVMWLLKQHASRLTSKTENNYDDAILTALHDSLTYVLVLCTLFFGVKSLNLPPVVDDYAVKGVFVLLTIKITYELEKIVSLVIREHLEPLARRQKGLVKTFVPSLLRLSKFIFWLLAAVLIVSNLGYNVGSLLAGLGIGGLALALAAQEALGNFFGSLILISDQPFKVGDFVKVDGYSGTIKEVGMRSTKLQTIDKSVVSIPNKKMSSANIENISKQNMYKVSQVLGVTYSTSLKDLNKAMEQVRGILRKDKDVDNETARVNFLEFGDSALQIEIFYYISDTSSYAHMLEIRERVNLQIKRAFEKLGVQMAFPTRSLYLENAKDLRSSARKTRAR